MRYTKYGIPVVKNVDGSLLGIDAVIDKDSTSALLADAIDADELIMITSIDHACLNFGTSHEAPLNNMSITEARHYIQEGQFAEGSMQPKIQASIDFISGGAGKRSVLITSIDALGKALQKKNGTYIS
jgi:carbamate kinase